MSAIDVVVELLEREINDGFIATGGQLYVSVDGCTVVDIAHGLDGLGERVSEDTLFAVYCAGKPVVAVAIGHLVDRGEVSFDDVLGDVIDGPLLPEVRALRVGNLMNHTAGLHGLLAASYMSTAARRLDEVVMSVRPPPGWQVGRDVAYSEVAAWHLLGRMIADLSGESVRSFIRRSVLEPAGILRDMFVGGMSEDEYLLNRTRMAVNIWLTGRTGDPLLTERTRRLRCATNAAVSTSANAKGLGRFYEALLRVSRGQSGVLSRGALTSLTSSQSHGYDRCMDRQCGYGFGFMVGLNDHDFGRLCSESSFGHSGNGGMTAALCDPVRGAVVAYHLNGRIDAESAVKYHRPVFIDRIFREVLDNGR